jgi:hypothetical protein
MKTLVNKRINYILRDLLSKAHCESLGEEFYKTNNPAYRFAAYLALDLEQSTGFKPSKELQDMITFVVWNGEE